MRTIVPARFSWVLTKPVSCEVERSHQQYLVKNPYAYCPMHAIGIKYDG